MPEIIKLEDIKEKKIIKAIKEGKVFIYPTDTVYGLGCNAKLSEAVLRIRELKDSKEKPFSVIAPSKQWIYRNLEAKKQYIQKLPGPFTFVMKIKKPNIISSHTTYSNLLGVRIPGHEFIKIIQKAGVPFITTSLNITGRKHITEINKVPRKILNGVDIVIDAGKLDGKPSSVFDISGKIVKILR